MVGRDCIKLLLCGAILLGWTWDTHENDLALRGYGGFTFGNSLAHVKGANWSDPYNFSDMRLGNGTVFGAGADYFVLDWLSLRADAWYQPKGCGNCIKQQGVRMISVTSPPTTSMHMMKGWKGDAIVLAPSVVFHTPAMEIDGHVIHAYGGGGPTFTMSRLGDQHGYTDSNDLGIHALIGLTYSLPAGWSLFAELHRKEDYMDCEDKEGCFRGRRYTNHAVIGLAWTWGGS